MNWERQHCNCYLKDDLMWKLIVLRKKIIKIGYVQIIKVYNKRTEKSFIKSTIIFEINKEQL